MTEQVRLTGDRSTYSELNDSMVYDRSEIIAFSRYTESINRISHQYLIWEDAQNEFRNYQEMYRTAEGLARSSRYSLKLQV